MLYNVGKKEVRRKTDVYGKKRKAEQTWQYTSKIFHDKLIAANMRQSMSRVGGCIDSVPMEGFWGILKSEMYYIQKVYFA